MTTFTCLVGLSGSGKSALANDLVNDIKLTAVVSSDMIRKIRFGDEKIQGDNNKIFEIAHKTIIDLLNCKCNVIFDATNLNRKNRRNILNKIPKDVEKKCVIVATDYDTCLERNNNRERHVPSGVITRQRESFQIPSYNEGWNRIEILYTPFNKAKYTYLHLWNEIKDFNQDNSHHSFTLGEHIYQVYKKVCDKTDDQYIQAAAILHDIGKIYTKTFTTMKGVPTIDSHYFGHDSVGAYESLFYLADLGYDTNEILDICLLVQWHMQPYFMKTNKSKQKLINEFGQEFYDRLMILHEADESAH